MKKTINNENYAKRKNVWVKRIFFTIITLAILGIAAFFTIRTIQIKNKDKITTKTIAQAWEEQDYNKVYEDCKQLLQENPYNNKILTYYSYSAFYLAVSQTDSSTAQTYLDEAINMIRIALYDASDSLKPQLQYMLGKSYFYKNTISTHYYADLAVKYLLEAKNNGYKADDIPEYLGLSYAALGMTMESISSFTEALLVRESDSLLLSIAEQYYKTKEYNAAKQYLYRIIKNSENDEIIIKSENLLGNIYIDEGNYDDAFAEFNNVLQKNKNSADAHYGIGVIYEKQNNIVKARSEWREALKIQVNHPGALKKISENR